MNQWFKDLLDHILGSLAPQFEVLFTDYSDYEAGKPVVTPTETISVSGGHEIAVKASVLRKATGDALDFNPQDIIKAIAQDAQAFFGGQIVTLAPFTIPFQGEFAEVTLSLQYVGAIGSPVAVPPHVEAIAQGDFPHPIPVDSAAPARTEAQITLDRDFPRSAPA